MKNYLIAGGTSGIGFELVRKLAADGHNVHCACRTPERLAGVEGIQVEEFDATEPEFSIDLPEELDGFVYFPGTINLKPFKQLEDSDYLNDFEINVMGAVRLLKHALPALKKGNDPSVVFFSTVAVQTGLPYHSSVAAAKGALEGLTRSLAAELAPKIRVNAIAPSLTDTNLASGLLSTEDKRNASAERHPLKRIGDPSEIAGMAEFLLSDSSRFITGQIYKMDGGLSALKTL